jgi:hypothetical protein
LTGKAYFAAFQPCQMLSGVQKFRLYTFRRFRRGSHTPDRNTLSAFNSINKTVKSKEEKSNKIQSEGNLKIREEACSREAIIILSKIRRNLLWNTSFFLKQSSDFFFCVYVL